MPAGGRPPRKRAADTRRRIPSVDALLSSPPGKKAATKFGRAVVRQAIRSVLDDMRGGAKRGSAPPEPDVILARAVNLAARMSYGLSSVINATGVVLHTNLGRAPLPARAARAAARAATSYSDLEIDRETGARGRRTGRAEFLLTALTGAEDALVVNNNAAALLLALAALARGKQVLVSRGELIEIGGEFRLPEIMAASGAKLVEVGTTNRTRRADYERAVSTKTALILKVHPSNYELRGFTAAVEIGALAEVARRAGVPLLYDIGSGLLSRSRGVPDSEPTAVDALHAGSDLVCFSGDKLLGGPQAGIILGTKGLVERLRRHAIARAVRVDKMTIAALESVLALYSRGEMSELPVWRALTASQVSVKRRAAELAAALGGRVARSEAAVGGGSFPGHAIPSYTVAIPSHHPDQTAARLRLGNPPVVCRVQEEALVFDLRTVDPNQDDDLRRAISYVLSLEE
ncbi:MAG: L-seryl-tRNA(Sec) selenium transferase [Actinomycetota bacterium]